jgi:uncharacterized protein (UPF0210 family)
MDQHKIIRSVCLFTDNPSLKAIARLGELTNRLSGRGFTIQTQRLCSPESDGIFQLDKEGDGNVRLSIGRLNFERATGILDPFCNAKNNVDFNVDLTHELITIRHISLLTNIIHSNAGKTFSFAYTFNNALSSPFFPSASYEMNGFAIGLQPTNLSEDCKTIEEWLERTKEVWSEIDSIFATEEDYLGIDTSIAPLFAGSSSFINFLNRIGLNFSNAVTTDVFIRIARFIREEGPKKVGLCGLMFACLEDFELAEEYEEGNFSIERNAFLSLHSGLGIDAYPIGIDENPERVTQILKLMQGLSNKYSKPLSIRLVSDGIAKVGQKTNFGNPYLKDVIIRPL